MTSKTQMNDTEIWRAIGRNESVQSITHNALFFGAQYSVIKSLWKEFLINQIGRPMITTPADDQYVVAKRNQRVTSVCVLTCDICGSRVHC